MPRNDDHSPKEFEASQHHSVSVRRGTAHVVDRSANAPKDVEPIVSLPQHTRGLLPSSAFCSGSAFILPLPSAQPPRSQSWRHFGSSSYIFPPSFTRTTLWCSSGLRWWRKTNCAAWSGEHGFSIANLSYHLSEGGKFFEYVMPAGSSCIGAPAAIYERRKSTCGTRTSRRRRCTRGPRSTSCGRSSASSTNRRG